MNVEIKKFSELFKICLNDIPKEKHMIFYQTKWTSNFHDGKFRKANRISKLNSKLCREEIERNSKYYELKQVFSEIQFIGKIYDKNPTLLEEFIETYLFLLQKIEFDQSYFLQSIKILESHIKRKFSDRLYFFTPIYDFDTEFEKIEIGEFIIQKITTNQFDKISGLDLSNEMEEPFIDFEQKQLKFILSFSIEKNPNSTFDLKKISANILNALRLTTNGSIYFGSFYRFHPLNLQGDYFPGSKEIVRKSTRSYFLKKEQIDSFKEIYYSLNQIYEIFDENKTRYLTYSIRRFDYVYRDYLVEDNITDLMISLETILNNQPFEIRDKTSLRAAIILEDSDDKKIECKKFIQKCYDMRSEIVHGKKRSTKIKENEVVLTDEEVKNKLENFVRTAIIKTLKLQIKFKTQDTILNKIDSSVLNRGEDLFD
jgi:hypothetical protein